MPEASPRARGASAALQLVAVARKPAWNMALRQIARARLQLRGRRLLKHQGIPLGGGARGLVTIRLHVLADKS